MIPRISGVSRLPSRRSSVSSLVTIAELEIATAPAMTSASRSPHPNAKPSTTPASTFSPRNTTPAVASRRPPASRSRTENSRPRWKSSITSPNVASSPSSSGESTSEIPGVCGPERDAGEHEERDRREPDAAAEPAEQAGEEQRPAERDQRRFHQPATSATSPGRSSGRPITMIRSPALEPLVRLGRDDRLRARPHERDDRHPGPPPDLQLRDRAARRGRAVAQRHPVDEEPVDDRLDLLERRRLVERARSAAPNSRACSSLSATLAVGSSAPAA